MGRRAKKAPVVTKKRVTLAKRFKCPFCANENAVECKMDNRAGVGSLQCRLCGASYQMPIHHLHEPIDVFSEWLDDCEAAERGGGSAQQQQGGEHQQQQHHPQDDSRGYFDDSDSDDDLGEASGLHANNDRKPTTQQNKSSSSQQSAPQQPTYTSLGLDDSDDDSE